MEVILNETVPSLGFVGDVVNVKNGYARNYLFPRGLALEANLRNRKEMEHRKKTFEVKRAALLQEAQAYAKQFNEVTVVLSKTAGEEGKLFGSVTAVELAEALKSQGMVIDRKLLVISAPIKAIGSYTVSAKLHPDVIATIKVEVKRAGE